jgi:hypothetical protein
MEGATTRFRDYLGAGTGHVRRLVGDETWLISGCPLSGRWSVQDVGYDVVVLDGPSGALTLKIEAIVGVQVEEVKKPPEPQVEK